MYGVRFEETGVEVTASASGDNSQLDYQHQEQNQSMYL